MWGKDVRVQFLHMKCWSRCIGGEIIEPLWLTSTISVFQFFPFPSNCTSFHRLTRLRISQQQSDHYGGLFCSSCHTHTQTCLPDKTRCSKLQLQEGHHLHDGFAKETEVKVKSKVDHQNVHGKAEKSRGEKRRSPTHALHGNLSRRPCLNQMYPTWNCWCVSAGVCMLSPKDRNKDSIHANRSARRMYSGKKSGKRERTLCHEAKWVQSRNTVSIQRSKRWLTPKWILPSKGE